MLLGAELVAIAGTRLVKGIEEKRYVVARSLYLNGDDVAGMSVDDHVRAFAAYMLLVQQGFQTIYVLRPFRQAYRHDGGSCRLQEVQFYATDAEFDAAMLALNQALRPLLLIRQLTTVTQIDRAITHQ